MIIKPKGTRDIYGKEAKQWKYIDDLIDALCEKYNYNYIRIPIIEASEVFHRAVGTETDIVSKETYDFIDRGKRNMTLRPEGTAGIVRSFIENKMYGDANQPVKLYYNGTMYRYDRPQAGRYREFTQFGVEVLGSNDPYIDAEVISIPYNLYKILGLENIVVNINSLGDNESRKKHNDALVDYLTPRIGELCEDCQKRFKNNPLRILDCKIDGNSEVINNAPKTLDYLNEESNERFELVKDYLDAMDIEYKVNSKIIRGLDYYNHTVFEIEADIESLGAQNVLCGGGRYNGLTEILDGPKTPGMGFAMGLDRLQIVLDAVEINVPIKENVDIYVMYVNENEKQFAISISQDLRMNGFITEIENMGRSLKSQFKQADRLGARYLIILNSEDIKEGFVNIKDNITKEEEKINYNDIVDYIDMKI